MKCRRYGENEADRGRNPSGKWEMGNGPRLIPLTASRSPQACNRLAERELQTRDLAHEEDGARVALPNGENEWAVGAEYRKRGSTRTHHHDAN